MQQVDEFDRLRETMARSGKMSWLGRLDDWHHEKGCIGSWVFCDLWDAYVTREYKSILYGRSVYLRETCQCISSDERTK